MHEQIAQESVSVRLSYGGGLHFRVEVQGSFEGNSGGHVLRALNIRFEILFERLDVGFKSLLKRLVDSRVRSQQVNELGELWPVLLTVSLQQVMHQHPRLSIEDV